MAPGTEWRARDRYIVSYLKRDASSALIVLEVRGFV